MVPSVDNFFSYWLIQRRKELGLDVREFARITNISRSSISRLENNPSPPTFPTVIRICEGLGLTSEDFLQLLPSNFLKMTIPKQKQHGNLLLQEVDILDFLTVFSDSPNTALQIISYLFELVILMKKGMEPKQLQTERDYPTEFIQLLLEDQPFFHGEIFYPPLSQKIILETYRAGGAITLSDVGIYVKHLRREKKGSLAHFEETVKRSKSVLARLEGGLLDQIKLSDVIMLSEQLDTSGEIFDMYWNAVKLQNVITDRYITQKKNSLDYQIKSKHMHKLMLIFVSLCRWLQYLQDGNSAWLDNLRVSARDAIVKSASIYK